MKKFLIFSLILICAISFIHADDTQFFTIKVSPDVFLIFDTSGSMAWDMAGHSTYGDGSVGGSESVRCAWYTLPNWHYYGYRRYNVNNIFRGYDVNGDGLVNDSRLYIVKTALYQVLEQFGGLVRWGLAKFYQRVSLYSGYYYRYCKHTNGLWLASDNNHKPAIQYHGQKTRTPEASFQIVADIPQAQGGSNQAHINLIESYIDNSVNNNNDKKELRADGGTPTAGALRGVRLHYGNDIIPTDNAKWCRKYFVVLITDGEPNWWGGKDVCVAEADSLRHTYVPAHGSDTAMTVDIQTYVIGVGLNGNATLQAIAEAGGTEHYYPANNPQEVIDAFEQIFSDILMKSVSYTAVSIPTVRNLNTNYADRLYSAFFIPRANAKWEGHLKAFNLPSNGQLPAPNDTASWNNILVWDAHDILYNTSQSSRNSYVVKDGALHSISDYTTAEWDSMLGIDSLGNTDSLRNVLINFVYGSANHANLGDVFHSSPLLIGTPNLFYEDDEFRNFRDSMTILRQGKRIVISGANDGLLHVFKDTTGEEICNIMLEDQIPKIKNMLKGHSYYVDGEPSGADIWFPATKLDTFKNENEWRTIVMVGERQGGRGYSAFDFTDTYNPIYKFHFTNGIDTILGETWSKPMMYKIQLALGADSTTIRDRFIAFFGGGYWNDSLASNVYNDNRPNVGKALYFLNIEQMAKGDSIMSEDLKHGYKRMTNNELYPVPSAVTVVDTNDDSKYDLLYVGDIAGQLWKVDMTNPDPTKWVLRKIFVVNNSNTADEDQPFFYAPTVTFDEQHRLWVFFGTGDRAEPMKLHTDNYIIGLYDDGDTTTVRDLSDLEDISNDGDTYNISSAGLSNYGWKYSFKENNSSYDSRKVLSSGVIVGDTVYFTVFDPEATSIDICSAASGYSYVYKFNMENAGHSLDSLGGGIPQTPQVSMDMNGNVQMINTSSEGGISSSNVAHFGTLRRLLWWKKL